MVSIKKQFYIFAFVMGIFLFITIFDVFYVSITSGFLNYSPWDLSSYSRYMALKGLLFFIAGILFSLFSREKKGLFFLTTILSLGETKNIFFSLILLETPFKLDSFFVVQLLLPFFIAPIGYFLSLKTIVKSGKYEKLKSLLNLFWETKMTIVKIFIKLFLLTFLIGWILKKISIDHYSDIFVYLIVGFIISLSRVENKKKIAFYYGVFDIIVTNSILIFAVNFYDKASYEFGTLHFVNNIFVIPSIFAGLYLSTALVYLKRFLKNSAEK